MFDPMNFSNREYAGWNISREDYNSDSNPCEEDSSSFCYNRDDTISSIIKNIK